jgi:hypothetical protein
MFVPESPRWLVGQDRHEEALEVLAIVNAGGDKSDPFVLLQYREIYDTITWEKTEGAQLSLKQAFMHPSNRKRLILAISFSAIVMLPGNNLGAFYFGTMLDQAGITNPTTQLEINIILTAWIFVVSTISSYFADRIGRVLLCSLSLSGVIISMFALGALTAVYGTSTNTAGIYGTIASMFIIGGTYAFGIIPLTVLYPPEVLSFPIRATGMGLYTFTTKLCGLLVTMAFPFAFAAIGWKTYMINASFDVLMLLFVIFYWVDTKGLTLEEIDVKFDGMKHSSVPNLADLMKGKVDFDIEGVEVAQEGDIAVAKE